MLIVAALTDQEVFLRPAAVMLSDDVGLAQDRRTKANRKVKSGQGDRGDC